MRYSKLGKMFVALFPFSEVVYVIAICLAWVYIALGIMGNNQVAEADDHHHRREDLEGGVEDGERARAKPILEEVRDGDESHAPEPGIHEPVIGVHEQRLQREPDA